MKTKLRGILDLITGSDTDFEIFGRRIIVYTNHIDQFMIVTKRREELTKKCPKCYFNMVWRGACETVDGVKYRSYGCKKCQIIVRGEKIDE